MLESLKSAMVALSLCSLYAAAVLPGQTATLLRGYVSHSRGSTESPAPLEQGAVSSGSISTGSFPAAWEGNWRCLTVVTDSTIEGVSNGQQIESDISFQKMPDGRILANWNQTGWQEAQAAVTAWNSREAQVDRTDYFFGEKTNGNWAARSRDRFEQVDGEKMVAQSYVDQYIDGNYIGRYRTTSTLYRKASVSNIAKAP
jgi:hypothetical protein